ncbi:MAG: metallophosphoesterase family protein [Boseongicola sp.]
MRVQDFGRIDQPVLLFGGPYSNIQATEAFVNLVSNSPAICTGDVVAYGANPSETVALIRASGWPVVAGNCERQIAAGADDCGCGFGEQTVCDRLSKDWYSFAKGKISENDRRWMVDLPDIGLFSHLDRRYAVIHGGVNSINRYIWPSSAEADFEYEIAALEAEIGQVDGIVAGHSGMPFHRWIGRHQWINAGAIGLPPHDGRTQTRFARLDNGEVTIERLSYDYDSAISAMIQAGLTQGYNQSLATGIWPSEDVLPPELRR